MDERVSTISTDQTAQSGPEDETPLQTALKRSAAALKAEDVTFALAGGYALWVHGAPEPVHDVDLVVAEPDVPRAAEVLADAGFTVERPPEDWLFKAWMGDSLVDVLHRINGIPVTSEYVDLGAEREILGVRIPVLPPTPIVIAKLRSLTEHYCDFAPLLPVIRAVREQLDWAELRAAVADSPFAESFLLLAERLELAPPSS